MPKKRITLNGIVGILAFLSGTAAYIWTYYMRLRSMELFVPRVALGLIAIGGLLILIKDLIEDSSETKEPSRERILPYLVGVILVMWVYGWFFRNVGLLVSTFLFLSLWWIWLTLRDARRTGSSEPIAPKMMKLIAFALVVTASVYLLFIALLGMYLPRSLLF